jgi:hypothetical protein
MNKPQIIDELDKSIYTLEVLENVFIANKLKAIKESLINEWDLSDFYMDLLKKELYHLEN